MKKMSEFKCPNCGANMVVTESKMNVKAKERIDALKAAGIDVTNLFAISGSCGEEMIAKNVCGTLHIIADDDPIFKMIIEQGTVPNRNLFRRWVMAQVFHIIYDSEHRFSNVTEAIQHKGYEYQWKMLVNELNAQRKMFANDQVNFRDRHRWFNKEVIVQMGIDYIKKLEEHCQSLAVRKCKGIPYKKIGGKNIFVEDINKKIIRPVKMNFRNIVESKTFDELCRATINFDNSRTKLNWEVKQDKMWLDAYKGSGAYFTMQNLIRFHGCSFVEYGIKIGKDASLAKLDELAEKYKSEGWSLFGRMKQFINENGIDIKGSIERWKK